MCLLLTGWCRRVVFETVVPPSLPKVAGVDVSKNIVFQAFVIYTSFCKLSMGIDFFGHLRTLVAFTFPMTGP